MYAIRSYYVMLRRLAAQVDDEVKSIFEVSETKLIGGTRRQVRVLFDPLKLAARNLTPFDLINHLTQSNRQSFSGATQANNREILIQTGTFLESAEDIVITSYSIHYTKLYDRRQSRCCREACVISPGQHGQGVRGAALSVRTRTENARSGL